MLMLGSTLRAYFLCTACLLTPSMSAIACQLSPARRAASTWHSSRRSVSCRRAATARSPARGSAVSVACETISCGSMMSTVVAICSHVNLGCQTRPPRHREPRTPYGHLPDDGSKLLVTHLPPLVSVRPTPSRARHQRETQTSFRAPPDRRPQLAPNEEKRHSRPCSSRLPYATRRPQTSKKGNEQRPMRCAHSSHTYPERTA